MSSESPSTVFSVFIISDRVFNQSCSSDTALSNFGHGDALPLGENTQIREQSLVITLEAKGYSCAVSGVSQASGRRPPKRSELFPSSPSERKPLVPCVIDSYLKRTDVGTARKRLRSIYQYSDLATRFSGHTSIFGGVFFVSKSLWEFRSKNKILKIAILTQKPQIHVRILIYWTWPIGKINLSGFKQALGYRLQDVNIHYIASW